MLGDGGDCTLLIGFYVRYSLENPAILDTNRLQAVRLGTLGIVVSGSMLLLSIYMWAAYYVEQFTIHETTLSIRTLFRNRQFEVSELDCLERKATQPGSITFRGPGSKARLDLPSYSIDDDCKHHVLLAVGTHFVYNNTPVAERIHVPKKYEKETVCTRTAVAKHYNKSSPLHLSQWYSDIMFDFLTKLLNRRTSRKCVSTQRGRLGVEVLEQRLNLSGLQSKYSPKGL